MASWIDVGSEDMLADGAMQEVEVAGRTVLLAHVQGAYTAVQARCPHLRARLVRGSLRGSTLTCPAHGSTFDVTTGQNLDWAVELPAMVRSVSQILSRPQPLTVWETQVRDGRVWVRA